MSGTMLTISSRAMLKAAARCGVDGDALLDELGIEKSLLDDPDARLPEQAVQALWGRAYAASADPDLALHAAEILPIGAYRVIDFMAWNAPTIGQAFAEVSRYFAIISTAVKLPVMESPATMDLTIEPADGPGTLTRPYVEYVLAAVFLRIREATGVRFPLASVDFAFPQPPSIAEHQRIFDCDVRFGAAENRLRIPHETWVVQNARAQPELFGVLLDHARTLQAKVPREPEELTQVRQAIADALRSGEPSLALVARQLGMSPRTLQRRLGEHELRFADLLDTTREGLARDYLNDRKIALAEVAYLLGYSEQSAFNRAFKRWTGVSPTQFRGGI
jgi:AraC-like DNA-binding protein